MKKSFRGMTVLLATSVAVIPALILSVFAINRLSEQVEQRSINELKLKVESASRQVSFELSSIADRLSGVAGDSDVRRGVKSAFYLEKTDGRLHELLKANPVVLGAFLFDVEGMMVSGIPETYMAEHVYKQLKVLAPPFSESRSFSNAKRSIAVASLRLKINGEQEHFVVVSVPVEGMVDIASGYLLAMIPLERLTGLISVSDGEIFQIMTKKSPDEGERDSESGEWIKALKPIKLVADDNLSLLVAEFGAKRSQLLRPVVEIAWRLSIYAGVVILVFGIVAYFLAERLLNPLRRLEEQARSYGRGEYEAKRPSFNFREIESFSKQLSEMALQVKSRQDLQQAVFKSELDALRNQMNPHFLFNTLNAISTYMTVDASKASQMTEQLANLYRLTLEATKHTTISLGTECEIVKAYLQLESVRFGKRLNWRLHPEVSLSSYDIPGLVLQTITENAIKHGISKAIAGGSIDIMLTPTADGCCHIEVVNTGAPYVKKKSGGIGVENTRRRLDILYPGTHGFKIESDQAGATHVSFVLPPKAQHHN